VSELRDVQDVTFAVHRTFAGGRTMFLFLPDDKSPLLSGSKYIAAEIWNSTAFARIVERSAQHKPWPKIRPIDQACQG
jgi:hypothetical protein